MIQIAFLARFQLMYAQNVSKDSIYKNLSAINVLHKTAKLVISMVNVQNVPLAIL